MKITPNLDGLPFLLAPLPFIFISIYGAIFAQWPNAAEKATLSLFTDTILLNTVHGYFTLIMLFSLPSATRWYRERAKAGRRSFWVWSGVLAALLFFFNFSFILSIDIAEGFRAGSFAMFEFLLPLIALQHHLWQTMGLSIALSHIEIKNSSVPMLPQRLNRRERRLFLMMLVIGSVPPSIRWMKSYTPAQLPSSWSTAELSLWASAGMLCCLCAMLVNLTSEGRFSWRRALLLLRLVSCSLVPISAYGFYMSAATHGIEYAFVLALMVGPLAKPRLLWSIAGFIALGYACRLSVVAFASFDSDSAPLWLAIFVAGGKVIETMHYHFDREIFTMRLPENRRFAGSPLLETSQ